MANRVFTAIGVVLAIIGVSLALLNVASTGAIVVSEKWVKYYLSEVPVDLTIHHNSIYVLALSDSTRVSLYKISFNGDIAWRNSWSTLNESHLTKLIPRSTEISVALINSSRHEVTMFSYSPYGALIGNRSLKLSEVVWAFDVSPYWSITWGSEGDDVALKVVTTSSGLIYVIGRSSGVEMIATCLDGSGEILWSEAIGVGDVVSAKALEDDLLILVKGSGGYRVAKARSFGAVSTVDYIQVPEGFTPLDLHIVGGYVALTGYQQSSEGSINIAATLLYTDKGLNKVIKLNAPSAFTRIESFNNTMYSVGVAESRLIAIAHSVERSELDAVQVIASTTVALIGSYIAYREMRGGRPPPLHSV
ncbi:MAG: hypothetical protein QXS70_06470 [Desulfurococcaceae archaeon]